MDVGRFDSFKSVDSPFGGGQLEGDFYNEQDKTTRGASMAGPRRGAAMVDLKMGRDFGGGDFFGGYGDFVDADDFLKDHTKGLVLEHSPLGGMFMEGPDKLFAEGLGDVIVQPSEGGTRFSAKYKVPKFPDDPFFTLAPTTFRVSVPAKASPHDIGNALLEYLLASEGMDSTVIKVRPTKFWASANVFIEGRMVLVKTRVYYHDDESNYSVEFQRRTGCAVTFAKIYKQALVFFRGSKYSVLDDTMQGVDEAGELPPPSLFGPPPPPPFDDFSDIGHFEVPPPPPLLGASEDFELDVAPPPPMPLGGGPIPSLPTLPPPQFAMMLLVESPSLQAEAFNSLADIASERPGLFATETFVKDIEHLLTGPFPTDPEAEFAFTRLLAKVVQSAEVCQSLAHLLAVVADKVYARTTSVSAKKQLACALVEATKNLSSQQEYGQFMKELCAALPEDGTMDGRVEEHLDRVRDLLRADLQRAGQA